MNKILAVILVVVVVIVGVRFYLSNVNNYQLPPNNEPIACTMDAKICPDGSAVGRIGPKCEFALCPASKPTVTNQPVSTPTKSPDPATVPSLIKLAVGESGKSGNLTITLNKIVSDSRCPIGVMCIWAGELVANISITNGTNSTTTDIKVGNVPVAFQNRYVYLTSAEPIKRKEVTIASGDYRLSFTSSSDNLKI